MSTQFDVFVIGGGPAGYHAAIRAAQLGLKVACADMGMVGDQPAFGGTCLRVGCIPSKALLDSSRRFWELQHALSDHGIKTDTPQIDVRAMVARKDRIVQQFTKGIASLFKANKVTPFFGKATLHSQNTIQIDYFDGQQHTVHATNVILATGSKPATLPFIAVNGTSIVDNVGALSFSEVPKHLVIIGAGVIGLELGSVWRRLGAKVTILEAAEKLLPGADAEIAKHAMRIFQKLGITLHFGAQVQNVVENAADELTITYNIANKEHSLTGDKLLVAIGRRPSTAGVTTPDCAISIDKQGFIAVDAHNHTGVDGVWAIGDCVRGPMLAHRGFEEGIAVAELIAGLPGHVNRETIPWVLYTEPEIAWVGKTEEQLQQDGIPYRSGSFPFAAVGRAVAMGEAEGFVKVLAHAETDRILGMHIMGANASELIHEGVLAMEFKGAADDLARICHAHPSLSEAIHDAAMAVHKRAIHKIST